MENPTKMDDLGVPIFQETSIYIWYPQLNTRLSINLSMVKSPFSGLNLEFVGLNFLPKYMFIVHYSW